MKIFLADLHPQVRSALRLVLSQIPGVSVKDEAGDVFQLFDLCAQDCPDLILIDPELVRSCRSHRKDDSQVQVGLFTVLHRLCPGAKVVAMSSRLEVEQQALASGADGFISKTEPPDIFRGNISQIMTNQKEGAQDD